MNKKCSVSFTLWFMILPNKLTTVFPCEAWGQKQMVHWEPIHRTVFWGSLKLKFWGRWVSADFLFWAKDMECLKSVSRNAAVTAVGFSQEQVRLISLSFNCCYSKGGDSWERSNPSFWHTQAADLTCPSYNLPGNSRLWRLGFVV